jgi:hypothetical protein
VPPDCETRGVYGERPILQVRAEGSSNMRAFAQLVLLAAALAAARGAVSPEAIVTNSESTSLAGELARGARRKAWRGLWG